jgi:hypothetical protein
MKKLVTICLVYVGILLISPALAIEISINPTDARGIRNFGYGPFLLDFLSIDYFTEDRTVIEFDLSSIGQSTPLSATLDLGIVNWDPSPPDGIIDVFTFKGDGVVTDNEYYAGEPNPFTHLVVGDVRELVRCDVTLAVQTSVTAGNQFLGFRLSTTTMDRYFLGDIVFRPEPVLTVVPEPITLLLLGLGSLALLKKRRAY